MTQQKKVLVIDDDESILEVIKIILDESGYETRTIANGKIIKKSLNSYSPDLILLDIWMSGYDGREIAKFIKSREQTKNIPIVVITAHNDAKKIAESLNVEGYITKPFEIDELVSIVSRLITQTI